MSAFFTINQRNHSYSFLQVILTHKSAWSHSELKSSEWDQALL